MSAASSASARPIAIGTDGLDELEGDEGGEAEQRQAGDGGELLGDADVAGAGGDADADPDRPECEERGEEDLGEQLRRVEDDAADDVGGAEADADQDDEVDGVGDRDRREECGHGFPEQQLGCADGRGENRFECSLIPFADDRVGRDHGWDDDRDDQHQEGDHADGGFDLGAGGGSGDPEDGEHRRDQEDERQHRHRSDHEAVAPELAHLLAHDREDSLAAHDAASTSSSMSSR